MAPSSVKVVVRSLRSISFGSLCTTFSSTFGSCSFSLGTSRLQHVLSQQKCGPRLSFKMFFRKQLVSFILGKANVCGGVLATCSAKAKAMPSFQKLRLARGVFAFDLRLVYRRKIQRCMLRILRRGRGTVGVCHGLNFRAREGFGCCSTGLDSVIPMLRMGRATYHVLPSSLGGYLGRAT